MSVPNIRVQTPAELTYQHLQQLLSLMQVLGPFVSQPKDATNGVEFDPHVADSAAAVCIKACLRMEDILDDKARFNLEGNRALHSALLTLAQCQEALTRDQSLLNQQLGRPSIALRPTIQLVPGKGWRVSAGEVELALSGWGATPQEAMQEFDQQFARAAKAGAPAKWKRSRQRRRT